MTDITDYLKEVVAGRTPRPATFAWVLEARAPSGSVLCREEGDSVTVETGWECDHAVWTPEEAEDRRQEQGVDSITDAVCEWCEHINTRLDDTAKAGTPTQTERANSKLRLCHYIECDWCEERVPLHRVRDHLGGGCRI